MHNEDAGMPTAEPIIILVAKKYKASATITIRRILYTYRYHTKPALGSERCHAKPPHSQTDSDKPTQSIA